MERHLEQRLRDADPLARQTTDDSRDQDWLHTTARSATATPPPSRRPRALVAAAAAAAVVLAATAGGLWLRGNGGSDGSTAVVAAPTVTDLSMPANDTAGMCIRYSVEELAKAPVALGGTVAEKSGDEVLIDVDRWYRGGDSDQVRLRALDTSVALLGYGIDFQVGERYLLTAYDGTVNVCGFSGPWTQELADDFAAAFGGGA